MIIINNQLMSSENSLKLFRGYQNIHDPLLTKGIIEKVTKMNALFHGGFVKYIDNLNDYFIQIWLDRSGIPNTFSLIIENIENNNIQLSSSFLCISYYEMLSKVWKYMIESVDHSYIVANWKFIPGIELTLLSSIYTSFNYWGSTKNEHYFIAPDTKYAFMLYNDISENSIAVFRVYNFELPEVKINYIDLNRLIPNINKY